VAIAAGAVDVTPVALSFDAGNSAAGFGVIVDFPRLMLRYID
jgi:hypothetical protein